MRYFEIYTNCYYMFFKLTLNYFSVYNYRTLFLKINENEKILFYFYLYIKRGKHFCVYSYEVLFVEIHTDKYNISNSYIEKFKNLKVYSCGTSYFEIHTNKNCIIF